MQLNNLHNLMQRRKALRNRLTPAEASLWNRLKKSQLAGKKFRRQHSFGYYIIDFYCPAAKLVVELDGKIHDTEEAQRYDRQRDAFMQSLGLKVLRFRNEDVLQNMSGVLQEIERRLVD